MVLCLGESKGLVPARKGCRGVLCHNDEEMKGRVRMDAVNANGEGR